MTKEELKKEAIKFAVDYPTSYGKGYKHKDLRIAYLAGAEPREKRITELEKENEELKNLIKSEHEIEARKNNRLISQLTKAKEIIRAYMLYCKGETQKYKETEKKAEQFLKEKKQ